MARPTSRSHILFMLVAIGLLVVIPLLWYGFVWVPAQRRYFNNRNLRVLATLGDQISKKMESFDSIMDHAADWAKDGEDRKAKDKKEQAFENFFKRLIPDLRYQKEDDIEQSHPDLCGHPHDPPSLKVMADEGTYHVFFGYQVEKTTIFTRSKIDDLIQPFVPKDRDFDVILVAEADGRVIFQQPKSGIQFTRIDGLVKSEGKEAKQDSNNKTKTDGDDKKKDQGDGDFQQLRKFSGVSDVRLGKIDYRLYSQPIHLSFPSVQSLNHPETTDAKGGAKKCGTAHPGTTEDGEPVEWVLCGLVRSDRFNAMSLDISPTYIAWFSAALLLLVLAYPSLKLLFMSPTGRLRHRDGVFLAVSTFLVTGLLTFLLLDLYYYTYEFRRDSSNQLKRLTYLVNEHFRGEKKAIWQQLECFGRDGLFSKDLSRLRGSGVKRSRGSSERTGTVQEPERRTSQSVKIGIRRVPAYGRFGILADLGKVDYPFFQTVIWIDGEGTQRIKWDVRDQVTPFLNLRESHAPYYPEIRFAYDWKKRKTTKPPSTYGIKPGYSSNTGENVVVFWKLLEPPEEVNAATTSKEGESNNPVSATLLTRPLSLIETALPGSMQYAVVNNDGLVLFHSDPTRNLIENFFDECDRSAKLRSLVMGRGNADLSIKYLGRWHQAYVTPFGSSTEGNQGGTECGKNDTRGAGASSSASVTGNYPWSLVAFQDGLIQETMNLETLTLGSILFLLYGAILATLWGLAYLFWRKYPKNGFGRAASGAAHTAS